MYVIRILLPLRNNDGTPFPRSEYDAVSKQLTQQFGGVTAFLRAPAKGVWQDDEGEINTDDIVIFEVLSDSLHRPWWGDYRAALERVFAQQEVIVRAHEVCIL